MDTFNRADAPDLQDLANLGFGLPQEDLIRKEIIEEIIEEPGQPQDLPLDQCSEHVCVNNVTKYHLHSPPPFSSPENPIEITIRPKSIRTAHLDCKKFHRFDGVSKLGGRCLPFITVTTGCEPYSGKPLLALKDCGSTHTLISKAVFKAHKMYCHCKVIDCYTHMSTADNAGKLTCDQYVEMHLTFTDIKGKMITFLHPVFIVEGLSEELFIGEDILGTDRKIYETKDRIVLARDLSIPSKFVHLDDPNAYIIPIYHREVDYAPKIVAQRTVIIKAKRTVLMTQVMMPGLDYEHEKYCNDTSTIEAYIEPFPEKRRLEITLANTTKYDQILEIGDRLLPICDSAKVCATALLRQKIMADKYYNAEEKKEQLKQYDECGECSITASQYIDNYPHLQKFELPKQKLDYTPKQLIDGIPVSHLDPETQAKVRALFTKHIKVLAVNEFDVPATTLLEMDIEIKDDVKPMCPKFQPISKSIEKKADELLSFLLEE